MSSAAPPLPSDGSSSIDNQPGRGPLRAIARQHPLIITPGTTLREVMFLISQGDEDAAVVTDPETRLALGLVTLRLLLHVISAESANLNDPIAAHMIGAPLTLAADASEHRAKVLMAKRGVRHLLLTEPDGQFFGLLEGSDLLGLRTDRSDALIARIAAARDIEAMMQTADQVRRRGAELFRSGISVDALSQWMSGLNDLIGMRICELIEDEFDLPPVPWCWLVFGSEGRLEQTFATDQDNGLLFVPPDTGSIDAIRNRFLPFAQAVNEALHYCGFERCRGNIMAGNPEWCLSDGEWQQRFEAWLRVPDPEALLKGTIFFDFRPLYGRYEPVDALRAWLAEEAPRHPRFFRALAEQTLSVSPPLNWSGKFSYDRNRNFPHTIDLKQQGARLFVDAARLWGLQAGGWATGTAERLRTASSIRGRAEENVSAEIDAFHVIQRLRFEQQLKTDDPDFANRVDPDELNQLQRLMLKEAFRQAKRLQLALKQQFEL